MRVVVTGASGNVGTSLLRALGAADDVAEIVGLSRLPRGRRRGRAGSGPRFVGRCLLAGAEGGPGGRELADRRNTDELLCAPQGRGRAAPRPAPAGADGDPHRTAATRADLQAEFGRGEAPLLPGAVLPAFAGPARGSHDRARHPRAA